MNTREIAKEYRLSYWAGILRERKESGQSIRSFCSANDIREHVYYYWQRRLREAASQEMGLTTGVAETPVPGGWLVCTQEKAATNKTSTISIEVGGCKVDIPTDVDALDERLLAKVLRVLKSQC